jgi:hypothetical protein
MAIPNMDGHIIVGDGKKMSTVQLIIRFMNQLGLGI